MSLTALIIIIYIGPYHTEMVCTGNCIAIRPTAAWFDTPRGITLFEGILMINMQAIEAHALMHGFYTHI